MGNQKNSRNKLQWKHGNSKPKGCSQSISKKEVYNNTILPQETRKTSNRQPNFAPKIVGKRRTKKPKKLVEGKKSSRSKQKFKSERSNIKDYQCDTRY